MLSGIKAYEVFENKLDNVDMINRNRCCVNYSLIKFVKYRNV